MTLIPPFLVFVLSLSFFLSLSPFSPSFSSYTTINAISHVQHDDQCNAIPADLDAYNSTIKHP